MSALVDTDATDCRSRLIQAASDVFVEEGYRASIERIAAKAGVARQTLYNHFPTKADLFGEVVKQATAALLITLDGTDDELRARLVRFSALYRRKVLSAEGLGFYRAMVAETARFPELSATFYRTGPGQTAGRLTGVLRAAMERGELRPAAPEAAAHMLLAMLVESDRSYYLFSGEPLPDPDEASAARIVDCFLRAFAPDASAADAGHSPTPSLQRSIP